MESYNLITILGPTASGKTSVAAQLALQINGEIISADSRQVYRGMDIGTGKDLADYTINGTTIPYHLIDIVDAGYEYNVFEYQRDFIRVFEEIVSRNKFPLVCGGSGMYIEAVLKGYKLINVPVNESLREKLRGKSLSELTKILKGYKNVHNNSDIETSKRAIRAIEIEEYYRTHPAIDTRFPEINSLIVGIKFDREIRRQRITQRLKQRLDSGMVDEVKALLEKGISPESLIYYGLEYKFLTQYVIGEIGYDEMFHQLEIAIHQFAKRQMTWFRHMEKNGSQIHWLDGNMPSEEKIDQIKQWMDK
ncbi:MAG TPA: tRNA (adenosine(37)-N6)-dimethylallyltransferase MiaA [Prolixibacteraceae bacterium]|nr:tRNA (adenosine(37)-N6)-dimethylallyltransferase MiaA [Prolixibacteraceae bacterium]